MDDACQQLDQHFHRPGPKPTCSDSELMAMALIAQCRGFDKQTELIPWWNEPQMRALFPNVPERSRFNRRHRALARPINLIRQLIAAHP